MVKRQTANYIAFAIFFILLIAGINLLVAVGPSFDAPEKHTAVVEISGGAGIGKRTTSIEREREAPQEKSKKGKKAKKTTTTVERPTGTPSRKRTTTTEEGSRSFLERALGKSGLIGLQVAIVVLASFLAAALTQRALVGDFSVKVGNVLELNAVQDVADDTTLTLTAEVTNLKNVAEEHKQLLKALADADRGANLDSANLARAIAEIQGEIAQMKDQIATLEDKV